MSRKEALKELDKHLCVCETCPKKQKAGYLSHQHNRFQHYCHNTCKTGKKMRKLADVLDQDIRDRRKLKYQKGVSA